MPKVLTYTLFYVFIYMFMYILKLYHSIFVSFFCLFAHRGTWRKCAARWRTKWASWNQRRRSSRGSSMTWQPRGDACRRNLVTLLFWALRMKMMWLKTTDLVTREPNKNSWGHVSFTENLRLPTYLPGHLGTKLEIKTSIGLDRALFQKCLE